MKTKRIRSVLRAKGWRKGKSKGTFEKPCMCVSCGGTGERSGWVANGVYPNVDTWYEAMVTCSDCKGTGKGRDITHVAAEKLEG